MLLTVGLHVAIRNDDQSIYKHWGLFIDGRRKADKVILQAMGSDGRFRFDAELTDARQLQGLVELVYLCDVELAKVDTIKDIAGKLPIQNGVSGWNCQDYVLDLLATLEEKHVIDAHDGGYQERKSSLEKKQEGLPE